MNRSRVSAAILSIAIAASSCGVNAFVPTPTGVTFTRQITSLPMAKGFADKPEKREKSQGQIDREAKSAKYDDVAASGGQEYRIFVRQFGSDDESWLPTGSIAVPRGAQVSDAIFANEQGLQQAIVRAYPKLSGYELEFEYGYNLKIYPDDPVEVAMKGGAKSAGPSIGNWISNVLSPVDASAVPPPPVQD